MDGATDEPKRPEHPEFTFDKASFIEGWMAAREDLYPTKTDVLRREAEEAWRMAFNTEHGGNLGAALDALVRVDEQCKLSMGEPETRNAWAQAEGVLITHRRLPGDAH